MRQQSLPLLQFVFIGMKAVNLIILVDTTKKENMDVLIRFIANVIGLFKLKETPVTLVSFGGEPNTVFNAKTFSNPNEVQEALKQVSALFQHF